MSARLGIEIGTRVVRAVRLEGPPLRRRLRLAEVAYEPGGIGQAVTTLEEQLGRASLVAVAVDLPLLFTKHINLPPVPADEKRRIVTLEPERFFPVRGEELVVAARGGDETLVFATRESPLSAWLSALEALGPVELIEPGPVAIARALSTSGLSDCSVLVDRNGAGLGIIDLKDARVTGVRQVRGDADAVAAALTDRGRGVPAEVYLTPWAEDRAAALAATLGSAVAVRRIPERSKLRVADTHLAALGTLLGIGEGVVEALAPPAVADRIVGRRRRRAALAGAAFAASVVLALSALAAAHGREARALEREVSALRGRAEQVLAMRAQLDTVDRQARAVAAIQATRPDPLRVIHAITERLPPGAYLRLLRASGDEWQINGFAPDASSLIRVFEDAPEFERVRFTTATASARIDNRSYESFALALRVVPSP